MSPAILARNPQRRLVFCFAAGRRVPTREAPTAPGLSFDSYAVTGETSK